MPQNTLQSERDFVFEAPSHCPARGRLRQAEKVANLVFELAVRREILQADDDRPNAMLLVGGLTWIHYLIDLTVILEPGLQQRIDQESRLPGGVELCCVGSVVAHRPLEQQVQGVQSPVPGNLAELGLRQRSKGEGFRVALV